MSVEGIDHDVVAPYVQTNGVESVFSREFLDVTELTRFDNIATRNHAFAHGLLVEQELDRLNGLLVPMIADAALRVRGLVRVQSVERVGLGLVDADELQPSGVDMIMKFTGVNVRLMRSSSRVRPNPYIAYSLESIGGEPTPDRIGIPVWGVEKVKVTEVDLPVEVMTSDT